MTDLLPMRSTNVMERTTPERLTSWLTTVMMKGSTEPRDLMYTVPYLLAKMLPVSWRKKLMPTVIMVRFKLHGLHKSMKVPCFSSAERFVRISSNSRVISSGAKQPPRSLCRASMASCSRPFNKSQRGDYSRRGQPNHSDGSNGVPRALTSGTNQMEHATMVGMMKNRPKGICHWRLSSIF